MPEDLQSFENFKHFLSETLGVSETVLTPEAHFLYDLGIESLTLVELMLQMEIRLGRKIPLDTAWGIETVGDAYRFYVEQMSQNSNPKGVGNPAPQAPRDPQSGFGSTTPLV